MDNHLKLAYLKAACLHVGAELDRVVDATVYDHQVALVVDNGIKGCPKYVIPLVELQPLLQIPGEPADETGPGECEEVAILTTKVAQTLADEQGLDLATLTGTGRDGRISVGDVRRALQALEEEE